MTENTDDKRGILKNLTPVEELRLDACDGSQTIADSKGIFGSIDSDFINWGANTTEPATKEIVVDVYEMVKHANFAEIFGSLAVDLNKLSLTQHQILNFVTKYRSMLRAEGNATFFLVKSSEQFFVVRIRFDPRMEDPASFLRVRIRRFDDDDIWGPARRRRVVVPR